MRQEANDNVATNLSMTRTWEPGLDEPFSRIESERRRRDCHPGTEHILASEAVRWIKLANKMPCCAVIRC